MPQELNTHDSRVVPYRGLRIYLDGTGSVTIDNQTIKAKCELWASKYYNPDSNALDELFLITGAGVK
jgi:hypothetical protein